MRKTWQDKGNKYAMNLFIVFFLFLLLRSRRYFPLLMGKLFSPPFYPRNFPQVDPEWDSSDSSI